MLCHDNQQKPRSNIRHCRSCLPKPVFTHGQIYVVLTRVTSKKELKMLILNEDNEKTNQTIKIVYKEIFTN